MVIRSIKVILTTFNIRNNPFFNIQGKESFDFRGKTFFNIK